MLTGCKAAEVKNPYEIKAKNYALLCVTVFECSQKVDNFYASTHML